MQDAFAASKLEMFTFMTTLVGVLNHDIPDCLNKRNLILNKPFLTTQYDEYSC